MDKYTAKDLIIMTRLTPLGMDALTDLVMNDRFGRDMNAIIDSAIILYWRYIEEENSDMVLDEHDRDDEEDTDVIFDESDKYDAKNEVDINWDEVIDPWTFGGM